MGSEPAGALDGHTAGTCKYSAVVLLLTYTGAAVGATARLKRGGVHACTVANADAAAAAIKVWLCASGDNHSLAHCTALHLLFTCTVVIAEAHRTKEQVYFAREQVYFACRSGAWSLRASWWLGTACLGQCLGLMWRIR